jgi:hypothetical protein
MPPDEEFDYLSLLQQERDEIEHMCSLQAEEIERLQESLAKAKELAAGYKRKISQMRRAGESLHSFIDELVMADLIHDELLDKANAVCDKWEVKGR